MSTVPQLKNLWLQLPWRSPQRSPRSEAEKPILMVLYYGLSREKNNIRVNDMHSQARFSHFSSVAQSCPTLCNPMDWMKHARLPCPSPTPRACSKSCPLSQWCHPTISSSAVPFSSCVQSFPASGSFPMSQFFTLDGQSIGVWALASVLPMNTQDWFPLGWTGWTSLQSKGLSRVFSSTTVQKHQFFSAQLSLWSNSDIHSWLLEKP